MSCVHLCFIIFVSSELVITKYEESNVNESLKKTNFIYIYIYIYSTKITTKQKSSHVLFHFKLE